MNESAPRIEAYRHARIDVLNRINAACMRVGREHSEVTLVAVSKTVPPDALRDAVAAGIDILGENRVQEAVAKAAEVPGAQWHLVGPLQSNKARRAVETFDFIQTLDSIDLARRLDQLVTEIDYGRRLPVLIQVNVDLDPAKSGVSPDRVEEMLEAIAYDDLQHIDVRGLMTVGRMTSNPTEARQTFRALRELSTRIRVEWLTRLGPELSMGMSDDFEMAIEEGATIVRVGRALFGERPDTHAHDHHHDHQHGG